MTLDQPVVLATKNRGKVSEFQELFRDSGIELKTLGDFGPIPPVIEDGDTFEENAVKKAQFTARVLGIPAIADDSGLTVRALQGAPGVYSSRYAGENADDKSNNRKLLGEMEDIKDRTAAFVCVLALAVPRGPALIYEGACEGVIARRPEGGGGFGYDPLFYYPPLQKTFAQLGSKEKNSISHRGKAIEELRGELDKVIAWLKQRFKEEPFQEICNLKPAFNFFQTENKHLIFNMLFKNQDSLMGIEMLSRIQGFSAKKLNPSGAPLLPNLRRSQALAVCYTAARLMPCIFGKRGACKFQV